MRIESAAAGAGFAAGLGLGILSYSRGWLIVVDWLLYGLALAILLWVLFASPMVKRADRRRRRKALSRVGVKGYRRRRGIRGTLST